MDDIFLIIETRVLSNSKKVINFYCHLLSKAYDKPVDATDFGSIKTSHRILAREVGTTRYTAQRTLQVLQEQGLISVTSIRKYSIVTINKANIDKMRKLKREESK